MLNKFLSGEYTKLLKIFSLTVITKFPVLQLQYVGAKTYSSIAVAAGGDMTFYASDTSLTATVDPNVGWAAGAATTDGVIDLSTPNANVDTMGELVDLINAYADYRAYLIGVLWDTPTDNIFDTLSATSIATDNGLTLYLDEDSAAAVGGTNEIGRAHV